MPSGKHFATVCVMNLNRAALKQELRDRNRSVAWLAGETGIIRQHFYDFFKGERSVSRDEFRSICEALQLGDPTILLAPADMKSAVIDVAISLDITPDAYALAYAEAV